MQMLDGGVLLLRMSGPLTAHTMEQFADNARAQFAGQARGLVLDYRGAVLAATDDELTAMLKRSTTPERLAVPGAFIVSDALFELAQRHALRMARMGYVRRCFPTVDAGHQWVLSMASELRGGG